MNLTEALNLDTWSEDKGFLDSQGYRCAKCEKPFLAPYAHSPFLAACTHCGALQLCQVMQAAAGQIFSTRMPVKKQAPPVDLDAKGGRP